MTKLSNVGLVCVVVLVGACAPNRAWRGSEIVECADESSCATALIERYPGIEGTRTPFELAFVEFTERGNVFDRDALDTVVDRVAELANGASREGALVVVFVHGWKHNAKHDNSNVEEFRQLLDATARLNAQRAFPTGTGTPRALLGIFVGWRGLSLKVPGLKELTYWERKSVATEVGKGGVTELLLRLERAVYGGDLERLLPTAVDGDADEVPDPNRSLLLVVGHSFGGAILLSAMNEVLLDRVLGAQTACGSGTCTTPFGHGLVLLNPAIEASDALQLREAVHPRCYTVCQDKLMHVISSTGDAATRSMFPLAQAYNWLTWSHEDLERTFVRPPCAAADSSGTGSDEPEPIVLREAEMHVETIGNYVPFRTGRLEPDGEGAWIHHSCATDRERCLGKYAARPDHISVAGHEPLSFISVDKSFIVDHNDVFNARVAAYMSTIVTEAMYKRVLVRAGQCADAQASASTDLASFVEGSPAGVCFSEAELQFDFDRCFNSFRSQFEEAEAAAANED